MLRYLFQRLLYTVFLLALLTVVIFIVIQLPPGDYLSTLISRLEQSGETISEENDREPQAPIRAGSRPAPALFQMGDGRAERQFRLLLRLQRTGARYHRRAPHPHRHHFAIERGLRLFRRHSHRHLFGHASLFRRRLSHLLRGLCRPGRTQFHAGFDSHVCRPGSFPNQFDRPFLARIFGRPLEWRQAAGHDQAPAHPDHRGGDGRHGRHDPRHARHSPR